MTTSYQFTEKVEYLLKKSGKTKKSLYDYLGMSMQGFDSMMKNNSFSAVRLANISDFFEIDITYFYEGLQKSKPADGGEFGDKVIGKMADDIDNLRQTFEEQLKAKDRQIEKLLDLLGKYEGAILEPLSKLASTPGADFPRYVLATLKQSILPTMRESIFLD